MTTPDSRSAAQDAPESTSLVSPTGTVLEVTSPAAITNLIYGHGYRRHEPAPTSAAANDTEPSPPPADTEPPRSARASAPPRPAAVSAKPAVQPNRAEGE